MNSIENKICISNMSLIDNLVNNPPKWWEELKGDKELYIEIRKEGYIDVYYNGGAVIKELRWSRDKYSAKIHSKYLNDSGSDKYENCPLTLLSKKIAEIKKRILVHFPVGSEKDIQAKLILNRKNYAYIDSEFQYVEKKTEKHESINIRIDLVKIESERKKIIFQELKRIDDKRLLIIDENNKERMLGKIKKQMHDYEKFIRENESSLLGYYNNIVAAKCRLKIIPLKLVLGKQFDIENYTLDTKPQLVLSDYIVSYTENSKKGKRVKLLIKNLEKKQIVYTFINLHPEGYALEASLQAMPNIIWSSIFDFIPTFERIHKNSSTNYNAYKNARFQFIHTIYIQRNRLDIDIENWENGYKIIEDQSFDRQSKGVLFSLLFVCFDEWEKRQSSDTNYCYIEEIEDARILKILINLKEKYYGEK